MFAKACWDYLCPGWSAVQGGIQDQLQNLKTALPHKFAMEIIILATWAIWRTRNDFFSKLKTQAYTRAEQSSSFLLLIHIANRKGYADFANWVSFR